MEEEKAKIEYILTKEDQNIRNEMLGLMNRPLFIQKYLYFKGMNNRRYNARVIVDNTDRISIIDKVFALKLGTNGVFIKQYPNARGATYMKSGRSSSRLKVWKSVTDKFGSREITQDLAEIVNPKTAYLMQDSVISVISTIGMRGAIMSGAIDNVEKAMIYYIRYSMRGSGVHLEQALNLYSFLRESKIPFYAITALRVAKDPNEVLKQFQKDEFYNESVCKDTILRIDTFGRRLISLASEASEKIDWTDKHFNAQVIADRLSMKGRRIEDILQLWEGGPVLKAAVKRPVEPIDDLPF